MKQSSVWRDLLRAISWHRRKLAVVAAVAAVLTGISAATPPAPPTTTVVVTRSALSGGITIGSADVETRELPLAAVPAESVADPGAVVGRTLVAPLPAGSVLTTLSVLSDRSLTEPGQVIAPVRVRDASIVSLLRVGDRIDVVLSDTQSGKTSIVARSVRVVTLPQPTGSISLGAAGGGNSVDDGDGQLVLLAVSETQATALAQASSDQIGVILH